MCYTDLHQPAQYSYSNIIFGWLAGSPLPTASSLPLTSYGSYSATSHSLDERASVIERANILKTRLHNLRTGQVSCMSKHVINYFVHTM